MRKLLLLSLLGGAVLVPFFYAVPADAQATRTWVSGVGDDANPCSRTAPCKTFAGAISKTAANGEINCLDPGGFGGVTITKAISIVCDYTEGGILAAAVNGIIINAGVNDRITLKGIDIEGIGTGIDGIRFLAGASLHVHKCQIRSMRAAGGNGINFAPSGNSELYVADSYITDNGGTGNTAGILIRPTGTGTANASVNRTQVENNSAGIRADGGGSTGASTLVVRDSLVAGNTGNGITGITTAGPVTVLVDDTAVLFNAGVGVQASGAASTVRIGRSTIANNVTGVSAVSSGILRTFLNNQIRGNLADGTPIVNQDGLN
jgi:hypothetical protein